ncbi:MAG: hypothetical protein OEW87_04960 [Flavobacteriaceae bacterium]|nr:hypothetical protein [Flavobacteriaceae bacterium]
MSKKDKHTIKKILSKVDLNSPSDLFTDSVMLKINDITETNTLHDPKLTSILNKSVLEYPESNFSTKVMARINALGTDTYTPLITKKGWTVLIFMFLSLIIYVAYLQPAENSSNTFIARYTSLTNNFMSNFSATFTFDAQISSILMISVLSLISLLLIDSFLRLKKVF